jgi:hypothetical protein
MIVLGKLDNYQQGQQLGESVKKNVSVACRDPSMPSFGIQIDRPSSNLVDSRSPRPTEKIRASRFTAHPR